LDYATCRELRELAIRGIDGPGLHVLDFVPGSFEAAPGGREAIESRKAVRAAMLAKPPVPFCDREPPSPSQDKSDVTVMKAALYGVPRGTRDALENAAAVFMELAGAIRGTDDGGDHSLKETSPRAGRFDGGDGDKEKELRELGWQRVCKKAPLQQFMQRDEVCLTRSISLPEVLVRGAGEEGTGEGSAGQTRTLEKAWSVAY
jgi:hypothetical protein